MIEGNVHPSLTQPYDASNSVDVEKKKIEALRREKDSREVLVTLLQSRNGRAWVYGQLEFCGVFQTSFSSDALAMAFNEGRRNYGLRLLAEIQTVSPEALLMMLTERGAA